MYKHAREALRRFLPSMPITGPHGAHGRERRECLESGSGSGVGEMHFHSSAWLLQRLLIVLDGDQSVEGR
jgi:hypothetical protein